MKYTIAANNIKCFAKTIHCLGRLGTEIYLDCCEEEVYLKTVNASRSTFASLAFNKPFFEQFEPIIEEDEENPYLKCKISVKTLLQVFRSLNFIERSVEACEICLSKSLDQLIFTLNCRHAVVKTFQLNFEECEGLNAVYNKDLSPNKLVATSKLLQEVFGNFPTSLDEISLSVSPCKVTLCTFAEEDEIGKAMSTEMNLNPKEFSYFQVGVDSCVSFSLKDLRAVLSFAESFDSECKLTFEYGGKPFVLEIVGMNFFTAHFVLATISRQSQNGPVSLAKEGSFTCKEKIQRPNDCNIDANITNKRGRIAKQRSVKSNFQTITKSLNETASNVTSEKFSFESDISAFVSVKELFLHGMQQSQGTKTILAADSDDES